MESATLWQSLDGKTSWLAGSLVALLIGLVIWNFTVLIRASISLRKQQKALLKSMGDLEDIQRRAAEEQQRHL